MARISSPPARAQEREQRPALREAGTGRPTKRERRAIGRFTAEDEPLRGFGVLARAPSACAGPPCATDPGAS